MALRRIIVALALLGASTQGADFIVRYGGNRNWTINDIPDTPVLTLMRGETYTFDVFAGQFHPFLIQSAGVSNNNTHNGIITYTVPMVESNYFYLCSYHGFGNRIVTVPTTNFRIRSLSVGSNVVLKSTGPSNYTVVPEFNTNLSSSAWRALAVQTNRFLGGTNETICGKPPGDNIFVRIMALEN